MHTPLNSRALPALAMAALLLAAGVAQAQTVRLRGTLQAVDTSTLTLKERSGEVIGPSTCNRRAR